MKKSAALFSTLAIALTTAPMAAQADVLSQIRQTGELRVGMRDATAPFSFRDKAGQWSGICPAGLEVVRAQLQNTLKRPVRLVIEESSISAASPDNRFAGVRDGRFALECGPNTILRQAPEGVTFSLPFYITGTYLLANPNNSLRLKPNGFMENATLGVLENTITGQFLESRYPQAKIIEFKGNLGRQAGIRAALEGSIDAFGGEGIVLIYEAHNLGFKPDQYRIIPRKDPLTCVAYGLILPAQDKPWVNFVNDQLLNDEKRQPLRDAIVKQIPDYIDLAVESQEACS
jgi:polar amino acid transport system substrate-binding protein